MFYKNCRGLHSNPGRVGSDRSANSLQLQPDVKNKLFKMGQPWPIIAVSAQGKPGFSRFPPKKVLKHRLQGSRPKSSNFSFSLASTQSIAFHFRLKLLLLNYFPTAVLHFLDLRPCQKVFGSVMENSRGKFHKVRFYFIAVGNYSINLTGPSAELIIFAKIVEEFLKLTHGRENNYY